MTRPSSISSSLCSIILTLIITQPYSVSSVEEVSGFLLAFCDTKGSRVQFSDCRSDWKDKSAIHDDLLRANRETLVPANENYHDFSRKLFDQVSICCSITVLNTFQLTYEVSSWLTDKCSSLPQTDSLEIVIQLKGLPRIWSWTGYSSENHSNYRVHDDEHLLQHSVLQGETNQVNSSSKEGTHFSVNKRENNITPASGVISSSRTPSVQHSTASITTFTEYTCVQSNERPGEVAICSFDHHTSRQDSSSSSHVASSAPSVSPSARRLNGSSRNERTVRYNLHEVAQSSASTAPLSSINRSSRSHTFIPPKGRSKRDHPHRHHNRDPTLRLSPRKHHSSLDHDHTDHRNRFLLLHGSLIKINCPQASPNSSLVNEKIDQTDASAMRSTVSYEKQPDQTDSSDESHESSHNDTWTNVHFSTRKKVTFKFHFAPVMAIKGKTYITIKRNDQLLRLKCRVYGSPLPQVQWLKDSMYLVNSDQLADSDQSNSNSSSSSSNESDDSVKMYNDSLSYSISKEAKSKCSIKSTLTLTVNSVDDLGWYHCIAKNKYGKVHTSYRVEAESPRVFTENRKFNFTGFLIGMIPPIVVSIFFILKLGYRSRYASANEDEAVEQEMYTDNNLNLFT